MRCPHAYRDETQDVKARPCIALSPSPTLHSRSGARRGWGRAQRHVERVWRAGGWGENSGITAPLSAGLSGFLFGEENRVKSEEEKKKVGKREGREKGSAAYRGLGGGRSASAPSQPSPQGPARGRASLGRSGSRAGPAGCARPLICRACGRRAGWGLFVTLLPRSPRSPGSGLRRSLPLAAAASAGAICCCRFWRSAIQKQTSSMTTNSYSQMY